MSAAGVLRPFAARGVTMQRTWNEALWLASRVQRERHSDPYEAKAKSYSELHRAAADTHAPGALSITGATDPRWELPWTARRCEGILFRGKLIQADNPLPSPLGVDHHHELA
ncbi:MAG: hypothetical protein ABSG53_19915 [Thermoguttaceae bacterium]